MAKSRVAVIGIALALVLGLGIFLGVYVPKFAAFAPASRTYNTAAILQQVQTLSQLVTVKYVIEKVVILEDVKWFGESRVLMVAHGVVKGGLDFNGMKPEDLDIRGKKIIVRLPPAQILDTYLDENQTRVIERTTGLLRTFDKDLEQNARKNAVDDIARAARTGGILKDADERARAQLRNLFHQLGFEEVEFRSR
jgi:hypothetical protein